MILIDSRHAKPFYFLKLDIMTCHFVNLRILMKKVKH